MVQVCEFCHDICIISTQNTVTINANVKDIIYSYKMR